MTYTPDKFETMMDSLRNVLEFVEAANAEPRRKARAKAQFGSLAEAKRMLALWAYFQRHEDEGGFDALAAIEAVEQGLLRGRGRPCDPEVAATLAEYRRLAARGVRSKEERIDRLQELHPDTDRERLVNRVERSKQSRAKSK